MTNEINEQDMIDAFKDSLDAKDIIKARVILSYIENVTQKTQQRLLFEIVRIDVEFQLPLLLFLMDQHEHFCLSYSIVEDTLIAHAIEYPDQFANLINTEHVNDPSLFFFIAEKAKILQRA